MRRVLLLLVTVLPLALRAAEPVDVDPNTKTEGGADLRGSGASAGSGARADDKVMEDGTQVERRQPARPAERGDVAGPDHAAAERDKPISARKPRERELEDASKGITKPQE